MVTATRLKIIIRIWRQMMNRKYISDNFWIKYLNASNRYVADVYHALFMLFRGSYYE